MTEAYSYPDEVPKRQVSRFSKKVADYVIRKSSEFIGAGTYPGKKDRLAAFGVLGLAGLISTAAQYRYGPQLEDTPWLVRFFAESGRHFPVGLVGAALVSRGSKLDNMPGMLVAATAADVGAEAAQSLTVTGMINDGWSNTGDFVKPDQLIWGNIQDLGAAASAAVGFRTRLWMLERKTNRNAQ